MKFLTSIALLMCAGYYSYGQETFATGSTWDAPPAGGYKTGDVACFTLELGTMTTALNYAPANGRELYFGLTVSNLKDITLTLDTDPVNGGLPTSYFDIVQNPQSNNFQTIVDFTQNSTIPTMGFNRWRVCGTIISAPPGVGGNISYSSTMDEGAYTNPDPTNDEPFSSIEAALPVTLIHFSATRELSQVNLSWQTTEETNSDYFEVQRSIDAKNWHALTKVKSNGESRVLRNYDCIDASPSTGMNYYRLKMVDKDASFAYSSIRSVKFNGEDALLYPNPATTSVQLKNVALEKVVRMEVLNLSGETLLRTDAALSGTLNVSGLRSGLYVVRIRLDDGTVSSHKITVIR